MLANLFITLAGLAAIVGLAEVVIRYAIGVSHRFNVQGSIIGLTLLSIGTSIPEIFAHVVGSVKILNNPDMMETVSGLVLGTNVGSDIVQQDFVLPLVAFFGAVAMRKQNLWQDMTILIAATVFVGVLGYGGVLSRLDGALLVFAYILYLAFLTRRGYVHEVTAEESASGTEHPVRAIFIILGCLAIMGFATDQVVEAADQILQHWGISASFFGILFIGIASVMPELSSAFISVFKGKRDISAGILIGSNITNPLLAIGTGALISTYKVPDAVLFYDLPVKFVTAGLLFYFLMRREKLLWWESVIVIGTYITYIALRSVFFPADF